MTRRVPLPILSPDSAPKEKCGVFGIWGHQDGVRKTYLGLYAQQHRGQESAGITVTDGDRLEGITGMGLVPEVFDERKIQYLEAHYSSPASHKAAGIKASGNGDLSLPPGLRRGRGVIGHNRYSTAGGSLACNAQPLMESYVAGQVALAHNGNLVNAGALRARFEEIGR